MSILHPPPHSLLYTGSLFLANLFLIHYWDLFFLPWVSEWREGKGSLEFLMLHMKNVALVISQQYELVNFFCRTQHSESRDAGKQWEDGGGGEGSYTDVIRSTAHLEWFECQRLFVDESSQCLSFWEFVIHQENLLEPPPPPASPPFPSHLSHRASLTALQTADGSRSALWNGKIPCQDRNRSRPHYYIWRAFQSLCTMAGGRYGRGVGGGTWMEIRDRVC